MAFSKLTEVRTGKLALRLFCSVENSALFLAADRIVDGRKVQGLLLSESDVRSLVALLGEHREVHARWQKLRRIGSTRWSPREVVARCCR